MICFNKLKIYIGILYVLKKIDLYMKQSIIHHYENWNTFELCNTRKAMLILSLTCVFFVRQYNKSKIKYCSRTHTTQNNVKPRVLCANTKYNPRKLNNRALNVTNACFMRTNNTTGTYVNTNVEPFIFFPLIIFRFPNVFTHIELIWIYQIIHRKFQSVIR